MAGRLEQMPCPVCTRAHRTPLSKGQQLLKNRCSLFVLRCSCHEPRTTNNEPRLDQLILWRKIMNIIRIVAAMAFCLSALALGGCQTTTSGGAVGAERKHLMLVSSQELDQMAAQSYNKLKADAAAKGTLNTDRAMEQRLRAIAARIEPQTRVFRADAPAWKWEVNVISSNELNAYCMPGGKIMFYSGLIRQLNLSDDEIAVVMGHEIAHALREHSREQVSQAIAAQSAIGVGAALLGLGQGSADMAGVAYQSLIATRFSRTDENEADRIGLELTARAGYDPRAGVS